MPIIVAPQSEYTQTNLNNADIQSLISALSPIVTLPYGLSWSSVQNININFSSDSSGSIGISVLIN